MGLSIPLTRICVLEHFKETIRNLNFHSVCSDLVCFLCWFQFAEVRGERDNFKGEISLLGMIKKY